MNTPWLIVLPVKRLDTAKSRLANHVGPLRREIALAMTLDTISVVRSCSDLQVVVVTDDQDVAAAAHRLGANVVADAPRAGINAALVHGAREAAETAQVSHVAALAADLPALRASELRVALSRALSHAQSYLPDANGTGTTLYASTSVDGFEPRFGPGSAAGHAAVAAALDPAGLSSVRRDVDTIADLQAATRLGLNSYTAAVVARLDDLALRAVRPAS